MRVPPEIATLEAEARTIREAGAILLNADMFDRWGPKDDVAQREAIEREADGASERRRAAVEAIERLVPALREREPRLIDAWADAHVELLDECLARAQPDSTEAFVARQERDKWAEVRAGTCSRFDQNTFYVRYDRELYRELFGLDY